MNLAWLCAGFAGAVAVCSSVAPAQIAFGSQYIELEPIASGLVAPVQLKAAPDGSGRLFVVDQSGKIRIIRPDGTLVATPFLDVTAIMAPLNAGYDERGLLGLAFHPQYATNGRFFVHYTAPRTGNPGDPCVGTSRGCSSEVIAEYTVSANPEIANPVGTVLLTVPKPQFNHAGGAIDFGPDGLLYIALGDGGGANDGLADNPPSHGPTGNAQNLAVKLGKILRYDVSTPGVLAIPPTNPFAVTIGADPAIYAYGVRNPYAFSFDDVGPGATGEFWVGEVGQDFIEEVDIVHAGDNLGWPIKEGFSCFDPFHTTTPPASCPAGDSTVPPVVDYRHSVNGTLQGIAVVGGYVYRGDLNPSLRGLYLFGDFSTSFAAANGQVYAFDPSNVGAGISRLRIGPNSQLLGRYLKGMGRDAQGELYYLTTSVLGPTGSTGTVHRIRAICVADFNQDGNMDQDDITTLIDVVAGGPNASGVNPDFNRDGNVDQSDIAALIDVVAGGPCR